MKGKMLVVLDPSRPIDDFIPSVEKAIRPGTKVVFLTPLTANGVKGIPEASDRSLTPGRK